MEFLNSNLPLILWFLVGFGLLLTEAFMAGFGVAGVLGIIAEVFAIYSAWVHYGPLFAFCLTVIILVLIWFTAKLGTVPMMKAQKCAEAGEPIPVIGSKEFRYMAKSYNKMHEKLYGSKEETK